MPATASRSRTMVWTPNADEFSPTAGALTIEQGGKETTYVVTEFPTGHPGRGFTLVKLGGGAYDVFCSHRSPAGDSCDCYDASYRRKACKHVAAVRKLVEIGKL